jgi:hypothetical protein
VEAVRYPLGENDQSGACRRAGKGCLAVRSTGPACLKKTNKKPSFDGAADVFHVFSCVSSFHVFHVKKCGLQQKVEEERNN